MIDDALQRANGNVELAMELLAQDIILFTNDGIAQERTIKVQAGLIEVMREREDEKEPGFLEKLSNSTVFKMGLFVGGVYLGREMVKVE